MNIKNFSHNDLDGYGASLILKAYFGKRYVTAENLDIKDVNDSIYNFLNTNPRDFDRVYITDISVNEAVAERIDEITKTPGMPEIVLIDHHQTAEWLNRYDWAHVHVYDNDILKASASSLLIQYLTRNKELYEHDDNPVDTRRLIKLNNLNYFAETVRQYDTWDWHNLRDRIPKPMEPKDLNDYFNLVDLDTFENDMLIRFGQQHPNDEMDYFTTTARTLLDTYRKQTKRYIDAKLDTLTMHDTVAHVFADQHHSELGNIICERHPEIDYVAIYDLAKSTVSFRTVKDDIDVSQIAKRLGGGGHAKAAGAPLDPSIPMDIIKATRVQ